MLSSRLIHQAIKESVYSFQEVAELLNVSRPHLYRMLNNDTLRVIDVNTIVCLLGIDITDICEITEFDEWERN